jgi:hypothetical protein
MTIYSLADGKPWDYSKVTRTSFYDVLATLRLQNQLQKVSDKASDLMSDDIKDKK